MKILIANRITEKAVTILKKHYSVEEADISDEDELLSSIKGKDILIVRSDIKVSKKVIGAAENLKLIGMAGTGTDNIDVEEATKKGIMVMNAPGANAISVAEHTFGLMISIMRNIPNADISLKRGDWKERYNNGEELFGKTLGIIGLGNIGKEVAVRARAFGMETIAFDPTIDKSEGLKRGAELKDNLSDVLRAADVLTIHVPLLDSTKKMLGAKELEIMKHGAFIINCARGGVIDEDALYDAILKKKIAGAALDVFENEPHPNKKLLDFENVIATPHIGASTKEAQDRAGILLARQIVDAFEKNEFRNIINLAFLKR